MSIIINKFNVNGIPQYKFNNTINKFMHKFIEFTLEFKFNKDDDENKRKEMIMNRLENIQKLDKSLNIYYRNASNQKIYMNNFYELLYEIFSNINDDNINITFCYDIPDFIINYRNLDIPFHVKYTEHALERKSMIYYLTQFINHISDFHKIIGFNYKGDLEINL